jgi:hypothetical protein
LPDYVQVISVWMSGRGSADEPLATARGAKFSYPATKIGEWYLAMSGISRGGLYANYSGAILWMVAAIQQLQTIKI